MANNSAGVLYPTTQISLSAIGTTAPILAGRTYTATIAVGESLADEWISGTVAPQFTLTLLDNGNAVATDSIGGVALTRGTWDDLSASWTAAADGAPDGDLLQIRLDITRFYGTDNNWGATQAMVDNARLVMSTSAAPTTTLAFQTGSGVGVYGGTTSLAATLTAGSVGVPNETVAFSINGTSVGSATTDPNGVATLGGVSLAGYGVGTYMGYVTASFAGDDNYLPSGGSTDLIVNSATVSLNWSGDGNDLTLTENTSGATPTIIISEPSRNISQLKIDLGAGHAFASGSTTSATGLTYQNPGSPTTSQFATVDISSANNVSALVATLPGDDLTLGQINNSNAGIDSITASAGTIEVTGINTLSTNGNVNLEATGNLTVDAGAIIETGTGTISLAADVNADGTGNDGVGTLSIDAGATVTSSNPTASAITLRGADVNVDTSANPAVVGASRQLSTTPTATLFGQEGSCALAFDSSGNLYVANEGNNTVSEFAPGSTTPTATLSVLGQP